MKLFAFAGPMEVNRECRKAFPHGHSISLIFISELPSSVVSAFRLS